MCLGCSIDSLIIPELWSMFFRVFKLVIFKCRSLLLWICNWIFTMNHRLGSYFAPVAQRIEQRFPKPCATGSSPVRGATHRVGFIRLSYGRDICDCHVAVVSTLVGDVGFGALFRLVRLTDRTMNTAPPITMTLSHEIARSSNVRVIASVRSIPTSMNNVVSTVSTIPNPPGIGTVVSMECTSVANIAMLKAISSPMACATR